MPTVKSIIKGPINGTYRKGPFYINFELAKKNKIDEETLEVTRKNVSVVTGVTVTGFLYANETLDFTMDIYVDNTKINSTPYEPEQDDNGRHIFNYIYE